MLRKLIISSLLLIVLSFSLNAQNSRILYFMNLPQSKFLNPAIKPIDSVYVGLPVVTGISLGLNNNFVNFSDIIVKGRSDSLITFLHPDYNTSDFLKKIKKVNFVEPELMVQLFALGFRAGRGYISFDVNERMSASASFPGSAVEMALNGNNSFAGQYVDLSSLRGSAAWYHEAGLGYSRNITPRLRAGVKTKMLLGVMSANIQNRSFGIRINQDYSHQFDADIAANISAPVTISRDQDNNISSVEFNNDEMKNTVLMKGEKNVGLGVDLGVTYQFTERVMLSAAVTDLGFIKWKNNVSTLFTRNNFEFTGLNMTDVINGTKDPGDAGKELKDSLRTLFNPVEAHAPFTTYTPSTLSLAGAYRLTKNLNLGVLSSTRMTGRQFHQSLTMSANLNLGSILMTSLSYTAANHTYDNIGAGVALRLAIFQFYVTADRIPLTWNKIVTDQNSFILPANWNTVDLRFGMNLVFGRHRKKVNAAECENMAEPVTPGEPSDMENPELK
ncbi:MAG TPA: DUF5723 family protein [Bacteroidales bacterium]|nr:DUF5723 family protein [Bacteroidales bacterium]